MKKYPQNIASLIFYQDEKLVSLSLKSLAKLSPNSQPKLPSFTLTGSGCREKDYLMFSPIFRISIWIGINSILNKSPYSVMITASHNPGNENGIKFGYSNGQIVGEKEFQQIRQCLNNKQKFQNFVIEKLMMIEGISQPHFQDNRNFAFVGRDCRKSSPQLSQIVVMAMKKLKIQIIDVGICTTPELFSFTQQLVKTVRSIKNIQSQQTISQLKRKYVQQTMKRFQNCYNQLKKHKKIPDQKPKILLDFSNGSGAVSFNLYRRYLQSFFDIVQINNKQFDNPNYQCGAEYFYSNWSLVTDNQQFQKYDQCFFFDGDADRIIGKIQSNKVCFDGNYFLMLYVKLLLKLNSSLSLPNPLPISAVITKTANIGIKKQLQNLGIIFVISDVGMLNLYRKATEMEGIVVFFQPNGHGGIYFSKIVLKQILDKIFKDFQQGKENLETNLLWTLSILLKNNSRGYGLHNMLTFFLAKSYLGGNLQEITNLWQEYTENIQLNNQSDKNFKNTAQRNNSLGEPIEVTKFIDQISNENKNYQILVRKSQTQKFLVRVNVQGQKSQKCHQICNQIKGFFIKKGFCNQK